MTAPPPASLLLLLGVLACTPLPKGGAPKSSSPSAQKAPTPAKVPDAELPPTQAAGKASSQEGPSNAAPPATPEQAFCHGRERCSLVERIGEPFTSDGFIHSVQRIVLITPEDLRHPKGQDAQGECSVEEYWFLKTDAAGKLADYQLLTGGCTGDDADEIWCGRAPTVSVDVSGSEVRASWYSPFGQCWSAFSSTGHFTASLVDFKRRSVEASTSHSLAGYTQGSEWNWETRVGTERFDFSAFSSDGSPLPTDRCPDVHVEVRTIPRFSTPSDFREGGWKSTRLESCSTAFQTAIKSSDKNRTTTSLHAFTDHHGKLYLQLNAHSAPSHDAFFEVCFGEETLKDSSYCQYPAGETCSRFSISGQTMSGTLQVEKAPGAYRYALDASEQPSARLMYRDPTKGVGIWSSPAGVTKRFAHSPLGSEVTQQAQCIVEDGVAQVLRSRPPKDEPVSNWGG